jgi:hypothetical protein
MKALIRFCRGVKYRDKKIALIARIVLSKVNNYSSRNASIGCSRDARQAGP